MGYASVHAETLALCCSLHLSLDAATSMSHILTDISRVLQYAVDHALTCMPTTDQSLGQPRVATFEGVGSSIYNSISAFFNVANYCWAQVK